MTTTDIQLQTPANTALYFKSPFICNVQECDQVVLIVKSIELFYKKFLQRIRYIEKLDSERPADHGMVFL